VNEAAKENVHRVQGFIVSHAGIPKAVDADLISTLDFDNLMKRMVNKRPESL